MAQSLTQSRTTQDWSEFLSSKLPNAREIIESLGFPPVSHRGIPKFTEPELQDLSVDVQKISRSLPAKRNDLLQFVASRANMLDDMLDETLRTHGPRIWGTAADRARLLLGPGNSRRRHRKTFVYEDLRDREIGLKTLLRLWVFRKAWNRAMSKKSERQLLGGSSIETSLHPAAESNAAAGEPVSMQSVGAQEDAEVTGSNQEAISSSISPGPRTEVDSPSRASSHNEHSRQGRVVEAAPGCPSIPSPSHAVSSLDRSTWADATPIPHPTVISEPVQPSSSSYCGSGTSDSTPVAYTRPRSPNSVYHTRSGKAVSIDDGNSSHEARIVSRISDECPPTPASVPNASMGPHRPSSCKQSYALSSVYTQPVEAPRHRASGNPRHQHYHLHQNAVAQQRQAPTIGKVSATYAAPLNHSRSRTLTVADGAGMHPATGMAPPVSNIPRNSGAPPFCGATLSQCELFDQLLRYLFSRGFCKADEPALLYRLACEWAAREQELKPILGQFYASYCQALLQWRELRLKASRLQTTIPTCLHPQSPETVQRLLDLNDVRAFYLKWSTSSVHFDGRLLTFEDLLCGTFALLTNTEGMEVLFKEGVRKLNGGALQLDDFTLSVRR